MDPVTMIYYAAVCAVLSVGVSRQAVWFVRLGIGALVGVLAAAGLPALRATLGY